MINFFEGQKLSFDRDKYKLEVDKDGISYIRSNGKQSVDLKFDDIDAIHVVNYCSQNFHYTVQLWRKYGSGMEEIDTDLRELSGGHNVLETKSILIAFAAHKLTEAFPDNLYNLDIVLGRNLKEKEIRLSNGVIRGAKHSIRLDDIRRVKCACVVPSLGIYTRDKGGFLDMPDMAIPANSLTLPILEAVMAKNKGEGIDFSRGNNFDQETGEFIIIRFMDSSFFVNADGTVTDGWQKIAHDRIQSYGYDLAEMTR